MLPYSAKKNIAKIIEEYSTLYPATNSASASGRSNGVRFVSAIDDTKNTRAIGNSGNTYQMVISCVLTISTKFKDPDIKMIGSSTKLIATS
jgi:hypothetical protein